MTLVAAFGDLHLDENSPRYVHALEVLDRCINSAIVAARTRAQYQSSPPVFVFTGDVFEGDPTPDEYFAFLQRVYKLLEHGLVLIVRGNHESFEAYRFFELLSPMITVAWDSFQVVDLDVARVLLVPYPVRYRPPFHDVDQETIAGSTRAAAGVIANAVREAAARKPVRPLLVFGHFTVEGMTTRDTDFERHSTNEVVVPLEALAPAAVVKVGHIHRAQQLTDRVGSVGDLYRCSFAEAEDPKIFSLITVQPDGSVTEEAVPTQCRGMREFALELDQISGQLAEITAAAEEGNEVKVTVSMDSTEVARYDQSVFDAVRAVAPYFLLEKDVRPVQRVRAPDMRLDMSLAEEFFAWTSAVGIDVAPDRAAGLNDKLQRLA